MLLAAAQAYGIESPGIPGMATGFCSGLSRTSGPCGAVIGAVMAIGLIQGRQTQKDSVDPCYKTVQDFMTAFKAEHGGQDCTELLGCDLSTPQGQEAYAQRFGAGENPVCCGLTVSAARILESILD